MSQLAASFMLLIGAGLLTRSLLRLYAVDPGFDLANVLSLEAPNFAQQNGAQSLQFTRDVLERIKGESAVQSAAMASAAPLAGSFPIQREYRVDGADPDTAAGAPTTVTRVVSGAISRPSARACGPAARSSRPTWRRRLRSRFSASRWPATTSSSRIRSDGI